MLCVHHKSSTCVEGLWSRPRWTVGSHFLKPHSPLCVCVCERPSHQDSSKYVAIREIMGCADSKSAGLANTITTVAAASNGQQQHQQPSSRDHSNFQTNVEDSAAGHCCLADEEDAAVKIQAFYRGYQTRRDLADKKEKELYGPGGKPGKKKKGTYPKPQAPTAPPPQQQPAAAADLQQPTTTLT